MSTKHKIKASSIKSVNPEPTRENKDIDYLSTDWVPFFKDTKNIYINDIALRYRRSATNAAIINAKVNYSVGNGWIFLKNGEQVEEIDEVFKKFLDYPNNELQTLEDVYKDICFNWITFGNVYIEVSRAKIKGTNKFATNLFVHDSTKVRINKAQTKAYISSHWRDINNDVNSEYKPQVVELWDKKKDTLQPKFIIHIKRRVPEYDYYGLPDYVATLKDCDIEYHCDTYNLTRLENGFFPSAIVSLFGEAPEGMNDRQYIDALNNKYSGTSNSGQPLFQLLDDASQAAQIQEFSGGKDGEFRYLEESAKKGIIEGHRWFPALAGIETAGKLGSNQEITNQWRIALETIIRPEYQIPMLRLLNLVLEISGFEYELDVINAAPVGIEDRINPSEVLDKNEQRELLGFEPIEEELQQPIEQTNGDDDQDNIG